MAGGDWGEFCSGERAVAGCTVGDKMCKQSARSCAGVGHCSHPAGQCPDSDPGSNTVQLLCTVKRLADLMTTLGQHIRALGSCSPDV